MKYFFDINDIEPSVIESDHNGSGTIIFRRLLSDIDFQSSIDFIDYTIIPPKSSIGYHKHSNNEEVYFVVSGKPLVTVDNISKRLQPGSISVVRSGQTHSLVNDTDFKVVILVIQVGIYS